MMRKLSAALLVCLASTCVHATDFQYQSIIGTWKNTRSGEKITFDGSGAVFDTLRPGATGKTSLAHREGANLSIVFGSVWCHYKAFATQNQIFLAAKANAILNGCNAGLFTRSYKS